MKPGTVSVLLSLSDVQGFLEVVGTKRKVPLDRLLHWCTIGWRGRLLKAYVREGTYYTTLADLAQFLKEVGALANEGTHLVEVRLSSKPSGDRVREAA